MFSEIETKKLNDEQTPKENKDQQMPLVPSTTAASTALATTATSVATSATDAPLYITRVKLIDQGAYGCIYRPEIECDSDTIKTETQNQQNTLYVSKVQKMSKTIQNEIDIGNSVKEIPHYMYWFSPILKICPVKFSTLKKYEQQGESCDILKDASNQEIRYISSKIRYVGKYIIDYLQGVPSIIRGEKIITTYFYLQNALSKLSEKGIIHNDIKENNVLYDEYNHSPNIIDFGISFKVSDLNVKEKEIFYTKKYYPYWCIQVYVLCQIVNREHIEPIEEAELKGWYNEYMKEFQEYAKETKLNRMIKMEDWEKHKESYWKYVQPWIGKPELKQELMKTHPMWDKFSLAITYLTMICKIGAHVPDSFTSELRNIIINNGL